MELVPKAEFSIVTRASKAWIPELIAAAGPEVTETYIDFFTATIRNRNTRQAYARACWQFFDWCAAHGLELTSVRPFQQRLTTWGFLIATSRTFPRNWHLHCFQAHPTNLV